MLDVAPCSLLVLTVFRSHLRCRRSWTGGLGQTIARQDPSTFRAFFWFIPNSLMRWHTSVAFDFDHGDGKLHRLNSLQAVRWRARAPVVSSL